MKFKIPTLLAAGAFTLGLTATLPAQASVVIAGTRVIYNAGERETTIKLSNDGQSPALTQAWLDKGDPKAAPASIDVPFTITPPVARIDPGKAQTLRILHTGQAMPQDKETLLWLNVLEVPPRPSADEAGINSLQLAFRSRIKFFYRPAGLKGSADDAPGQVRWRLTQSGGKPALEAVNPTPYHVSFARIELAGGGKSARFDDSGMVGPGETRVFPLQGDVAGGPDATVRYQAINDYGGPARGETRLEVPRQ